MQHIFIIGSKSLGAYGGYETFVYKLTEYHKGNETLKYHIACKANGDGCTDVDKLDGIRRLSNTEFEYHNAHCFMLRVPKIGPVQAVYYDIAALKKCCRYIKEQHIEHPVVYILACRIGPAAAHFKRRIHKLGGKVYVNPDGHEWMRAKWNVLIRKYWKFSERLMIKNSDLSVCDSTTIEQYIRQTYAAYRPKTTYIAYGAETGKSPVKDSNDKLLAWYEQCRTEPKGYYLVVGRFVPENNYETMIREFLKSRTERKLVLITNTSEKFLEELKQKTGFESDGRICFAGTVYEQDYLKKIRENAYAYLHGHEVGGTNPSLLEALGSTDVNLLLDVGFNREVAQEAAFYWKKEEGSLAALIDDVDALDGRQREELGQKAKVRIAEAYSWDFIASQYEKLFVNGGNVG